MTKAITTKKPRTATKKSTKTATKKPKASVAAASPAAIGKVVIPVDECCHLKKTAKVVADWDAMLNQTNIGHNNNKFYVIQLLENGGKYYTWTRWGRVGEPG